MIKNIYSVYDNKAELYGTPFFMKTNGEAVRAFKSLVNDKSTMPGQHPEDFQLLHLGKFDDVEGTLCPNDKGNAVNLGFGTDYLNKAGA